MVIGDRIREERSKKGLTQEELAKVMQVSPSTIGMYEQNRRVPDNEMLAKFADFFDTSIDYLQYGFDRARFTSLVNMARYKRSIKEFADVTGLDEFYLNRLCSGTEYKQPSIETVIAIAANNENDWLVDTKSLFKAAGYNFDEVSEEILADIPLDLLQHYQSQGLSEAEIVVKHAQYKKAIDEDAMRDPGYDIQTLAAHHDGEDWTEEELAELERFKEFLRSKRK